MLYTWGNCLVENSVVGNKGHGIAIVASERNKIAANGIWGNKEHGILLAGERVNPFEIWPAKENRIGSLDPDSGNVIVNNGGAGVLVAGQYDDYNLISCNSFAENSGLGIDLGPIAGVTPNDSCDADTGANEELNYPVIEHATIDSITGTAPPNSLVELYLADCDSTYHGEGAFFLCFAYADSIGHFAVDVDSIPGPYIVVDSLLTAIAIDIDKNTSEFCWNVPIVEYQPDNLIATDSSGSDYIGNNIYNTDGKYQTKEQSVVSEEAAIYYIQIQNDGIDSDTFTVTGDAGDADWTVTYYDAKTGGNDITGAVTGSGWSTGNINSWDSTEIRVEVTPETSASGSKEILITSTSKADTLRKDAVKAITTVSQVLAYTGINNPAETHKSFAITESSPNPFSQMIRVRFWIPETARISLSIYDASGRLVQTLVDEQIAETGEHEVVWRGRNNKGEIAPNGIYFCKLSSENKQLTQKLLLMR